MSFKDELRSTSSEGRLESASLQDADQSSGHRELSPIPSGAGTEDNASQYSFSSSVPTHQQLVVRSEVRGAMSQAVTRAATEETQQQLQLQLQHQEAEAEVPTDASTLRDDMSLHMNSEADDVCASSDLPAIETSAPSHLAFPQSDQPLVNIQVDNADIDPPPAAATTSDGQDQHDPRVSLLASSSSLLVARDASAGFGGPTPRKLTSTVSIATPPTSGISPSHLAAAISPSHQMRNATKLPPLEDVGHSTDEAAVRRRIEQLSSELNQRFSSHTPSRNTTFVTTTGSSAASGGSRANSDQQLRRHVSSSSVIPGIGGALPTVANGVDRRKMRDGLIAMSTEARKEDVRTILCKREIKLTEVLDEQLVLQKKLETLAADVKTLADQKASLEALRHNHHAEMIHLRSEVSALNKEINALKWDEGKMHQEITDLSNSLQRFRHKRSSEEVKRLQELNSVSYELATIEKAIEQETSTYKDEWQRLRHELRSIQEQIVSFSPQEWLAAAVAAGMKKKIAKEEFGGDQQKAHQYTAATLAAAGRRKTVANIETGRAALDAFLQGS